MIPNSFVSSPDIYPDISETYTGGIIHSVKEIIRNQRFLIGV